jgi:hypothetical protein
VRSLARVLDQRYHQEEWPHSKHQADAEALTDAIIERVSRTSALWQQFGFMCDLLVVDGDQVCFYKELPVDLAQDQRFGSSRDRYVLTLEFGPVDGDIFAIEREPEADAAHKSTFLHPIVRHYRDGQLVDTLHLLEDLHADWSKQVHIDPLKAFLAQHLKSLSTA